MELNFDGVWVLSITLIVVALEIIFAVIGERGYQRNRSSLVEASRKEEAEFNALIRAGLKAPSVD